jgi:tripartite-type tricarboxylate transporter receptor subunit TctC
MNRYQAALAKLATALACALVLAGTQVRANDVFPTGPVKIIVPTAPGGTADALPRILADVLTKIWDKPVVVEDVSGGGGNVGAELFSHAPPDGQVLLAAPPNSLAINQYLYRKINYDPNAFEPITILASSPNVLVINPKLGIHSVSELIARAKAEPGKLSFASQGVGSTGHLTGALFETMAGVTLTHVPYRGTAPAMNDLVGGHVDMMFDNIASSLPQYRSGTLDLIAVCSAKRLSVVPDIPTVSEAALPGFLSVSWFGLVAPAGTPKAIIDKINADVTAVLKTKDVRDRYVALGVDPIGNAPSEADAFLKTERRRWSGVIEKSGLKID